MWLSQLDGRARYSPEFADSDMTIDPNATYSTDAAARGSAAFRFPVDLNESPDLRRVPGSTAGHVTDGTGLPCSLFIVDSRSVHHVFGSTSVPTMGDDEVSFPLNFMPCAHIVDYRRVIDESYGFLE